MSRKFHNYQTKLHHHEFDEMDIYIEQCAVNDETIVVIDINDGSNARTALTLDELRELVRLGERFQHAHAAMKGSDNE